MTTFYLQKTLTTAGNSFGFSGSDIQLSFDDGIVKLTETLDKLYGANVQRPYSKGSYTTQQPKSLLVDLKQLKNTWTIAGIFTNDSGSNLTGVSPATTAMAVNKKNLLRAFAEQGGTMTLVTRDNPKPLSVNVIKLTFDDEETEVGDSSESAMKDNERRISYTIIVQEGVDR